MGKIEYVLWGTKNDVEDIIRVNNQEVQTNYKKTLKIKKKLEKRKEFQNIRIQKIDYSKNDVKESFEKTVRPHNQWHF